MPDTETLKPWGRTSGETVLAVRFDNDARLELNAEDMRVLHDPATLLVFAANQVGSWTNCARPQARARMADGEISKPKHPGGEFRAAIEEAAAIARRRPPQRDYDPTIAFMTKRRLIQGRDLDYLTELLEVDLGQIALWAVDYPEMYAAITPTELEISAYHGNRRAKATKEYKVRKARQAKNPSLRLAESMRTRMWSAMKRERGGKKTSSLGFLGYSMQELVVHLEIRFLSGMSWANYGKWHIDHIKPCARFDLTDAAQFKECWALENLQPLWATDNIKKGAKH